MKRSTILVACFCLVIQPSLALAETATPIEGADTRLYLADGSLVAVSYTHLTLPTKA